MGEYHNEKAVPKTKWQKLIYIILCPVVVGIVVYILTLIEGETFRFGVALPIMIGVSIPQWIIILFFPHFYRTSRKGEKPKRNQILKSMIFYLLIFVIIIFVRLFFK